MEIALLRRRNGGLRFLEERDTLLAFRTAPQEEDSTEFMATTIAEAQRAEALARPQSPQRSERYLSLDAYRGFIMILLVSVGFGFGRLEGHATWGWLAAQVEHVAWEGAVLWDLIQPAFIFMVGVAMPFALARRTEMGATFGDNFRHVIARALRLIALSQIFTMWHSGAFQFGLINVLSQIAFCYVICFLLMQLRFRWQVAAAVAILGFHWLLFVVFPGPDGAFSREGNIGAVIDLAVLGRNYSGHYVTINFLSSTVTALFGVWTGYLMQSTRTLAWKMQILAVAASAGLASGWMLSFFNPMVKRIWTASFTLYSAGWVLLMMLVFVWLIEKQGYRKLAFPMVVVGTNSIFAYVIFQLVRGNIDRTIGAVTGRFEWIGTLAPVAQACATLLAIWALCHWLYRRKIFLKL